MDLNGIKNCNDLCENQGITVYAEKLAGRVVGKGKGRVMGEEFSDPKEQEREDLTMIAKLKNISRVQSSFRYFRPGVGTSQGNAVPKDCDQQEEDEDKKPEKDTSGCNGEAQVNARESSSSARDKNMEASRGANREDSNLRCVDEDILSNQLVEVNLRVSQCLARDGNVETSRSVSHGDSNPRNKLSDTHMIYVEVQADLRLARGENLEAHHGASHDDQAQGTQSTEVISSYIPAYSSIVYLIQELAKIQRAQFDHLKKSIDRVKKDIKKQKKQVSKSSADSQC
nr:hypothetical protein Iba_chr13fCG5240 [Ipomoea batatas]